MNKKEFLNRKKKVYTNARMLCLFLFILVMVFCCILGLVLPIRPTESELEKRTLAEFPEFSVGGVLDGSYFSDISTWYSDSYPLRDVWMSGSNLLQKLYGIKTRQVITNNVSADEIPVVPTTEQEESGTEIETEAETETGDMTEFAEAVSSQDAGSQSSQSSASVEESAAPPAAIVLPTDDPSYVVTPITGQTINGMYIEGDTAYGMYFFNLEAAGIYIDVVNRTADELAGTADVYTLLIPNGETYYLTDEQRVQVEPDWRNEKAAIDYYAASFRSSVKNVDVYDALAAHSSEYIYFRTDHHWNGLGAYYAYAAWAQVKGIDAHGLEEYARMDFPGFLGSYYTDSQSAALEANPDTVIAYVPITYNLMTYTRTDGESFNWPIVNDVSGYKTSQKYSCYAAGDNPFSYIQNPNVLNGQACVVVKESYADAFIPFLTDHYQFIYWFDYRSYNGNILQFIRELSATEGVIGTDVLFVNGLDPISSVESMSRLSSLMQ